MDVINNKSIKKRVIIQSFDVRKLRILHKTEPTVKLSLLVSGKGEVVDSDMTKLGFKPDIYSPYYTSVDTVMVAKVHSLGMLILPWTVDEKKEMAALVKMGVDGIITNSPDRLVKMCGSYQNR